MGVLAIRREHIHYGNEPNGMKMPNNTLEGTVMHVGEAKQPNNALERTVNHRGALCLCERVSCLAAQLGR